MAGTVTDSPTGLPAGPVTGSATGPASGSGVGPGGRLSPDFVARLVAHIVSDGATSLTTRSPMDDGPLASIPQSSDADVLAAAARARELQRDWAQTSFAERRTIFLDFHDLVLDRQSEVLDLIQLEAGKARHHAFEEVADTALVAKYYARTAQRHLSPRRRVPGLPVVMRTHVEHHPKGVVAMITPWNYPLSMGITDSIPALMAGNAVLHKPDAQTPLSALWAVDLLEEAGLPAGLIQIVTGPGRRLGGPMIDHSDFVCFTGSTATGRLINEHASRRLIGTSLELGGKNAQIVLPDADLDKAAAGAVRAAFSSAGQLCIAMERVLVYEEVYHDFMDRFVAKVSALKLGAGLDFSADMGSLASADQLEKVSAHVEDARAKGATIRTGGRARPDLGPYFYEPTVLTDVGEDMAVCHEETFGPVVSVWPYSAVQDAIDWANDTPYGLNASVFGRDLAHARAVARQIRAGTVNINEGYGAAWGSVDAPMGGMGDSGLSRRHGREGIVKYTEPQTVSSLHHITIEPMYGISYENWARLLTTGLKVMKRVGM